MSASISPAPPTPSRPRPPWAAVAVLALLSSVLAIPATATAVEQPWRDISLSADQRADLLAAAMTLEQKIVLFSPDPQQAIPELGIPGRREVDGGTGITIAPGADTTAFPAGLALASTWDTQLAEAFGAQGGREAWLTGYAGWAAPAVDSLRNPFHGRQWASLGEDPVQAGLMAAAVVEGINSNEGVYSLPKHWLVNTQETQRRTLDNKLSERALRETYVRQWEPLVAADPGAVMCAFPRLAGEFSCENDHLLNGILKTDLGFPGWVSSDFNACYTYDAFTAGSDVCGPQFPTQAELLQAVTDGTIPADRFDDMVHRILRTYFERGLIDNPPPGSLQNPRPDAEPLPASVVRSGRDLAYQIAVEGSVLLRNHLSALPLKTKGLKSVAVIGEAADRFGLELGTAFQIVDDCLDLDGEESVVGKSLGTDLLRGKLTLPLLWIQRQPRFGDRLRGFMESAREMPGSFDTGQMLRELRKSFPHDAALQYAMDAARARLANARKALTELPPSPAREGMEGLVEYVLDRSN